MTNEEAIKWLVSIKKSIHGGDEEFDNRRKESVDAAIKALEDVDKYVSVFERLLEIINKYTKEGTKE